MQFEFYESTKLMGAEVQTPKDEEVAQVNDLVINSSDGHLAFLVLSNVAGRGDDLVAVPFSAFSRRGENVFVLNATKD
jgi:sporulation protein YlmC with PRC-barrel domain